jgi:hypothetical protein
MRRALAAQTGLAVLLWFFAAPFFHLHAADTEGRNHHQELGQDHDAIVHFHMPGHRGAGAGVDVSSPGEDEKPLDSVAIVQKHTLGLTAPFLNTARIELRQPGPDVAQRVVVPQTLRGHDPPDFRPTHPRAPPA